MDLTKPSQRKCGEGNKKSNLHIKKLRERNFCSVFSMNVRFFTFTVFWCEVSCKKCWSHRSHGNNLISRGPDPIYMGGFIVWVRVSLDTHNNPLRNSIGLPLVFSIILINLHMRLKAVVQNHNLDQ